MSGAERAPGAALLARLRRWADAHQLLPAGSRGVVAFSGGPDSLCLLDLLLALGRERGLRVRAVHVDHGLRPESSAQADQAAAQAAALGAEVVVRAVSGLDAGAGNLQERARLARHALLLDEARACQAQWLALGHTADDQAETVLMRLLRGSGVGGLSAMASAEGLLVRPLLGVTRAEVLAHLQARALTALVDPSNADPRYLRSRVRHTLLPLLAGENPALAAALGRLAQHCREDDQALDALARTLFARHRASGGLRLAGLRELPLGLLHRVLRLAFAESVGSTRRLTRAHVERLVVLLRGQAGSETLDLPLVRAERRYDTLLLAPRGAATAQPPTHEVPVAGEGRWPLGDGRTLLLRRLPAGESAPPAEVLPARCLERGLALRAPRPGDRIAIGEARHRRVHRLLIDRKVPRAERGAVLLVASDREVLLVLGLRRAAGYTPGPDEARLHFALDPPLVPGGRQPLRAGVG
ncbi:MAG: tRNA lysidine(34) synthetase TilS [Proteobacteria bacterium]|nr:tRNA lysidine(34) synthetase TilS [Pseudomonadota bacterium]